LLIDADEDTILDYMGKLHKEVQFQKTQAKRIIEYQHLFEVIFNFQSFLILEMQGNEF